MNLLFLGNLGGSEAPSAWIYCRFFCLVARKSGTDERPGGTGIREFNNAKNAINEETKEGIRDAERKSITDRNN
ncbi:MAG: twin-arginine translocase TatA/TatE family subunit [Saprospiraceae bacterium]